MHWFSHAGVFAAIFTAAVAGCYSGDETSGASPLAASEAAQPSGAAAGGDGAVGGAATGLPCEVDALLTARCRSCHGAQLMAPMTLLSYEDLAAPSKADPKKSTAALALERMTSATSPMPPSGDRANDAELGALRKWVDAGLPRGTCGGAAAGAEGGAAGSGASAPLTLVCTSGKTWAGTDKGPQMQPGRACITCHEGSKDRPIVHVGGTVYPTLREPDGCYGVAGGATVVITDSTGRVVSLPVGPTGNFSLDADEQAALVMPFRAKVVRNGVERAMGTPQSTGDCNSCHTETGKNGAPGRILLP